jgi:hypothetical protein
MVPSTTIASDDHLDNPLFEQHHGFELQRFGFSIREVSGGVASGAG